MIDEELYNEIVNYNYTNFGSEFGDFIVTLKNMYLEQKHTVNKAIEYIEKTRNTLLLSYPPKEAFNIDKLLDILKGSDKSAF